MIACGIEEPLGINRMLLILDEEEERLNSSGKRVRALNLSLVRIEGINRYCFVPHQLNPESRKELAEILRLITSQLRGKGSWLSAWSGRSAGINFTIRAMNTLARRKKGGWDVHRDGDLYVAVKPVEDADLIDFKPQGFDFRDGGFAYMCGQIPHPSEFVRDPLRQTIEFLARRNELTPSQPFLQWLINQQLGFAYGTSPNDATYGLVFVGHGVLDVASIQTTVVLDPIRYGAEAQEVWHRSNRE